MNKILVLIMIAMTSGCAHISIGAGYMLDSDVIISPAVGREYMHWKKGGMSNTVAILRGSTEVTKKGRSGECGHISGMFDYNDDIGVTYCAAMLNFK